METKATTIGKFIDFCDKARECMEGCKINVEVLDRYFTVAKVAWKLFADAII